MRHPLRNAILRRVTLGGAAVLALTAGAAFAADTTTSTSTTADGKTAVRHVVVVRDGKTVVDDWSHGDGPGMGRGGPHAMMMHREHHDPEQMAKHMRDVLQLTPAQEPALQAFLASMKPPHGPEHEGMAMRMKMERGPDGKVDAAKLKVEAESFRKEMEAHRVALEKQREAQMAMTTPQRLDAMVKHMTEESAKRQAEMLAHVNAVKAFYAALTPSQQKAFDALHRGGMGEGFRGMHGGEHEHGQRMMHLGTAPPMPPMPPMPPQARGGPPPLPPLPPEPPAPGDR